MDSIVLAITSQEEESAYRNRCLKIERRLLRDSFNPFHLDEVMFKKNYRLNKDAFLYILNILDESWECKRSFHINNIHKVCAVLRFLAEGPYQLGVGKDYEIGMAQPTVSKVLWKTVNILEQKLCAIWIKLQMSAEEVRKAQLHFFTTYGFPGVVMCVDGTHIKLTAPKEDSHLYYNRKGFYSLNAMLVCDHETRIRFVDARYSGCNHDAHIWSLSECRRYFENKFLHGERNSWILGDAAYPLEPGLMTPFRSPTAGSLESTYNNQHSKARNIIERTNGILKNRFRCLLAARQLSYTPEKVVKLVNVCSALHNICLYYRVLHELIDMGDVNDEVVSDRPSAEYEQTSAVRSEAITIRNNIANSM